MEAPDDYEDRQMKDDCTTPAPKCPMCNNARHVRPNGDRLWYCVLHDMLFDDSGDDGDFGYARPETNAMRHERQQPQRQRRR